MRNSLEILWIFFRIFWGFFLDFFWKIFLEFFLQEILDEIFWEDFWEGSLGRIVLGGNFCLHCSSQLSYLNLKGIDAFVKILSQCKEEGGRISILRSASASISHLKIDS